MFSFEHEIIELMFKQPAGQVDGISCRFFFSVRKCSESDTTRLERERQQLKAEYEDKIRNLQLEIEKEQETKFKGMKGPNKGISPLLCLKK